LKFYQGSIPLYFTNHWQKLHYSLNQQKNPEQPIFYSNKNPKIMADLLDLENCIVEEKVF
jgi:hypothetical protein